MSVISPLLLLDISVPLPTAADRGVARFIECFLRAAEAAGIPPVTSYAAPVDGRKQRSGLDRWLRTDAEGMTSLILTLGARWTARFGLEGQSLSMSFGCGTDSGRREGLTALLHSCASILTAVAEEWPLERGTLFRQGEPGFSCIPRPPAFRRDSHAAVVTSADIDRFYESREAVLAAWSDRREVSGQWVLFRGLDTLTNEDFLRVLIDSQWALARSARPRLTKFVALRLEPHEEPVYRAGSPTIQPVAHVAAQNLAEFTCTPPPGEFVRGWEIFNLRHLIETKALEDGRKVDTVRVMFLDRTTAEANKRPLLDIGARVAYADARGEPAYVEE